MLRLKQLSCLVSLLALLSLASCQQKQSAEEFGLPTVDVDMEQTVPNGSGFDIPVLSNRTNPDVLIVKNASWILIFDRLDSTFYFAQHTGNTANPALPLTGVSIDATIPELLLVGANQTSTTIGFDQQTYSVGTFSGLTYEQRLLNSTLTNFLTSWENDIYELSCKCIPKGDAAECEQGGSGSSGCEVTDGGGIGSANWNNHCSVTCENMHYACCNEVPAPATEDGDGG